MSERYAADGVSPPTMGPTDVYGLQRPPVVPTDLLRTYVADGPSTVEEDRAAALLRKRDALLRAGFRVTIIEHPVVMEAGSPDFFERNEVTVRYTQRVEFRTTCMRCEEPVTPKTMREHGHPRDPVPTGTLNVMRYSTPGCS